MSASGPFVARSLYCTVMDFLSIPRLSGTNALLEPLALSHAGELAEAVAEDDLHKAWYARVPAPSHMDAEVAELLAKHEAGVVVPWTIRRASDNRAVGMTSFLNIRPDDRRVEIGSTWISAGVRGTGINTDVKLLQLSHAFDALGCIAVELRTHWHNHRSRRAIAALGAKQDGVLRNHDLWRDGTVRDVVVFSVIDREWPTVKLALTEKLRHRRPEV